MPTEEMPRCWSRTSPPIDRGPAVFTRLVAHIGGPPLVQRAAVVDGEMAAAVPVIRSLTVRYPAVPPLGPPVSPTYTVPPSEMVRCPTPLSDEFPNERSLVFSQVDPLPVTVRSLYRPWVADVTIGVQYASPFCTVNVPGAITADIEGPVSLSPRIATVNRNRPDGTDFVADAAGGRGHAPAVSDGQRTSANVADIDAVAVGPG